MDLRELQAFCKIVELKSFSRAAEAVLLTQPTVSGHIKALEEALGLRLFDRSGKHVTPTQAGELLYGYARRMLAVRDEAEQALAEFKGGLKGSLCIGGSSIPGAYVLPPLIARFKLDYPDVRIHLKIGDSREACRAVAEGHCDLAAVGARFDDARLHFEPLAEDEMVLVVPSRHPWARRASVRLKDLPGQPFIVREVGSGSRQYAERALAERGLDPGKLRVAAEMGSNEAVREAVKAGSGVAILSRRAVQDDLKARTLAGVRIESVRFLRHFYIASHRTRTKSPACRAFLKFLGKGEGPAEGPGRRRRRAGGPGEAPGL
jgi:DNA-binding transcriptional LysR family regulator